MAKVVINAATPFGRMVVDGISKLQLAAQELHRANADAGFAGGGTALEGGTFGGAAGSGADYAFALSTVANALDAFMTTNAGAINTLDNGDLS